MHYFEHEYTHVLQYFPTLHKRELGKVLSKMTILKGVKDKVIVDFGEIGNEFFIIMEGSVEIYVPLPFEFHVSLN